MRIILNLHNSLLLAPPRATALHHRDLLIALLGELGFLIKQQKSDLEPKQDWSFICLTLSCRTMDVYLSEDKLLKLRESAQGLISAPAPTWR
jgi:hypothetical protein